MSRAGASQWLPAMSGQSSWPKSGSFLSEAQGSTASRFGLLASILKDTLASLGATKLMTGCGNPRLHLQAWKPIWWGSTAFPKLQTFPPALGVRQQHHTHPKHGLIPASESKELPTKGSAGSGNWPPPREVSLQLGCDFLILWHPSRQNTLKERVLDVLLLQQG